MKHYGRLPDDLGHYPIECREALYCLYLPVSLPGSIDITLPPHLRRFLPLVNAVRKDLGARFRDEYVYLTAKHMVCGPGVTANRLGWHSDGFMSDDLNYVWYDALPTVFNGSNFFPPMDHHASLEHFAKYARESRNITYPVMHLLKLDEYVIHRVAEATETIWRTFCKISVSRNVYNLAGNSRNYDLDYRWPAPEGRAAERNDPAKGNTPIPQPYTT